MKFNNIIEAECKWSDGGEGFLMNIFFTMFIIHFNHDILINNEKRV